MTQRNRDDVSFGYRNVRAEDKAGLVRDVFDRVASRYDVMNDLMSGGAHRIWKGVMLDRLAPSAPRTLLDVAGGTGDVAVGYLRRANARSNDKAPPQAQAVLCDINEEMLAAGSARKDVGELNAQLKRLCADAETLPVADRSVDCYSIAFGMRNVTDMDAALGEAFRVLAPGGRFACLEFSHPITGGLQKLYDLYSFNVIPRLGELVADEREAYEYLVESIRRFPAQDAFAARIQSAGFSRVTYENLTGGIAALHLAWRI